MGSSVPDHFFSFSMTFYYGYFMVNDHGHNTINLQNRSVKNIIIGMRVATCMRELSLIDQYTSPLLAISITLKSTLEISNHLEKMCSFMTGACMLGALNFSKSFCFHLPIQSIYFPSPPPSSSFSTSCSRST